VFALVGAKSGLVQFQSHEAHPNHPLATSLGTEFAINVNHAHLSNNSTTPCPEQFASVVLPQRAIAPVASLAVLTVASIAGLFTYLAVSPHSIRSSCG
jgi:lipoprotein LpqS